MNKINIFELKSKSEQEANEFFDKFIRKLPINADQSFNKLAGGFDDNDVDAIRHAYTSGIFTQVYGDKIALILGEMNELTPMGGSSSNNTNSSKMDLWNNKVGIKYGKKTSGKLKLFKFLLKALKNNELITDPENDPRISEIGNTTLKKDLEKVVVIKESKKGKNLSYFDLENKIILSKEEFVTSIKDGKYPRYEIRFIRGDETPVSKKDRNLPNNLG